MSLLRVSYACYLNVEHDVKRISIILSDFVDARVGTMSQRYDPKNLLVM